MRLAEFRRCSCIICVVFLSTALYAEISLFLSPYRIACPLVLISYLYYKVEASVCLCVGGFVVRAYMLQALVRHVLLMLCATAGHQTSVTVVIS